MTTSSSKNKNEEQQVKESDLRFQNETIWFLKVFLPYLINEQLKYIQQYGLFINREIDDIYFQHNILRFYHAGIFFMFFVISFADYLSIY